ncbi:hypothetical protein EfmE1679_2055 [Enterococcus faecium E1679]|nr:hypothetical protein EfmE1679_2055 [Enterococcus faecium E1679]
MYVWAMPTGQDVIAIIFFHFPTAFLSTFTVYKNGFFLLSTK